MSARSALGAAGLAALIAGLGACRAAPPDDPRPNVVLISVDTLRADALSAYGGPVETPNFDRLARDGVVFEASFAPAPATAASHASLFTGQEVLRHGILRNGEPLPDEVSTLAEAFQAAGYATGAFVSSFVLDPRFGWDQGFGHFDADFPQAGATLDKDRGLPDMFWHEHEFEGFDRRAPETTRTARAWLEQAQEPYFLFVHYFDPHFPYQPPLRQRQRVPRGAFDLEGRSLPGAFGRRLRLLVQLYHAEVLFVDESLGWLLAPVSGRDAARDRLVVVTGDHGEGLGQHGWLEHAVYLYDEQIRVPLVFQWEGRAQTPRRIQTPVGLVDVAPTVAELAGVAPPAGMDGRSLAESVTHGVEPPPQPIFAHRQEIRSQPEARRGEKLAVRTGPWKLIRSDGVGAELYALDVDPGELRNVAEERADVVAELGALLDAHRAAMPASRPLQELSDETRRALEALGYAE